MNETRETALHVAIGFFILGGITAVMLAEDMAAGISFVIGVLLGMWFFAGISSIHICHELREADEHEP